MPVDWAPSPPPPPFLPPSLHLLPFHSACAKECVSRCSCGHHHVLSFGRICFDPVRYKMDLEGQSVVIQDQFTHTPRLTTGYPQYPGVQHLQFCTFTVTW